MHPTQWAATTALPKTESTVQTGEKPESYIHTNQCAHFVSPWTGAHCFVHFLSVQLGTVTKFNLQKEINEMRLQRSFREEGGVRPIRAMGHFIKCSSRSYVS